MKNNKSLKQLCDALKASITETVPEGWFTMKQIAEAEGLSIEQTTKKIRKNIEDGYISVQKFKINSGSVCRPIHHYSLNKKIQNQ